MFIQLKKIYQHGLAAKANQSYLGPLFLVITVALRMRRTQHPEIIL